MRKIRELVIATKNRGKLREITDLLEGLDIHVTSLAEFENIPDVEETGTTFLENAELKARAYSRQTKKWCLADDSGLEVIALDNQPGVYSARFAGEDASDADNNTKLLKALEGSNNENRAARFVCSMVISDPTGEIQFRAEGFCNGSIAVNPCGNNGFGYDPLFIPDGFSETFGKLTADLKKKISHRAKALKKLTHFFEANRAS